MNLHDLPIWATPYPDESRWSWLEATRARLDLPEREWLRWADFNRAEPERSSPGLQWRNVPQELGDITRVPPFWRVSPSWRRIYCPECKLVEAGRTRHPVLVQWLDARVLTCERHGLLLCHMALQPPQLATFDAEIGELSCWLRGWMREISTSSPESLYRRDLVIASGRNWCTHVGTIASGELAWVLHAKGWLLPVTPKLLLPGLPARIGALCPMLRAAALLGAYRVWNALRGENLENLPRWPTEAWHWLIERSRRRNEPERRIRQLIELRNKTMR